MEEYERPTWKKGLRKFLGSIGYNRQFIDNFSSLSALLTPSIAQSVPDHLDWTEEMVKVLTG